MSPFCKTCLSVIVFILLFFLFLSDSIAQRYNFRTYSLGDGLVQSQITSVVQDADGNIWLATFGGGAAKFDGQNFKTYNVKDGLASNDVREIMQDSNGNLWFGCRNGISKFIVNPNPAKKEIAGQFRSYTTEDGLVDKRILTFFQNSKGNFWMGTRKGVSKIETGGEDERVINVSSM